MNECTVYGMPVNECMVYLCTACANSSLPLQAGGSLAIDRHLKTLKQQELKHGQYKKRDKRMAKRMLGGSSGLYGVRK
jgi:hypothetical protein